MKEIKSREGYYLTQSADVPTNERVFVSAIKGVNVNESDWREATEEEKEAYEKMFNTDNEPTDTELHENGDNRLR
jgi:hypothetical protein